MGCRRRRRRRCRNVGELLGRVFDAAAAELVKRLVNLSTQHAMCNNIMNE